MRSACRRSGGRSAAEVRPPSDLEMAPCATRLPPRWQCDHPQITSSCQRCLEGLRVRHTARRSHLGKSLLQRLFKGFTNVAMPELRPHHDWRLCEEDLSRRDGRSVVGSSMLLCRMRREWHDQRVALQHPCGDPHPRTRRRRGLPGQRQPLGPPASLAWSTQSLEYPWLAFW